MRTVIARREKAPVLTTRSARERLQPQATRELYVKDAVPVTMNGCYEQPVTVADERFRYRVVVAELGE